MRTWKTPKEVAASLGLTVITIRRWIAAGYISARPTPSGHNWLVEVDARGLPVELPDRQECTAESR